MLYFRLAAFLYREAGTLVAAGAHIVPKSAGGFEIAEWFNNVNGTKPTLTPEGFAGLAHGIDFDFDLEDKFMMCSIDASDSVTSICSITKASTKIRVTVWDTDAEFVGTAGFWVLVYGTDIQP